MGKVYMTIGLPGSGKSTWARNKIQGSRTVVISRDEIRKMIFGGVYKYDVTIEAMVKDMATACARSALCDDYDVILDETSLPKSKRMFWVDIFKREGHSIIYVHCPEQKYNLDYRMAGDGRGYDREYWGRVIEQLRATYEVPDMSEGCDEIITVNIPRQ